MAHHTVEDASAVPAVVHAELEEIAQKTPLCDTPRASAWRMSTPLAREGSPLTGGATQRTLWGTISEKGSRFDHNIGTAAEQLLLVGKDVITSKIELGNEQ